MILRENDASANAFKNQKNAKQPKRPCWLFRCPESTLLPAFL